MDPAKLREVLEKAGEPKYRLRQIVDAVLSGIPSYGQIVTLPKALRSHLEKEAPLLALSLDRIFKSRDGLAHKARLRLADGKMIEAVLMQPKAPCWTVCVSSQVGCALKCSFCATGLMGFLRNLTPEEITDQALFWILYHGKEKLGGRISNVVYMGMGEPMLNFDAVKESIDRLSDPDFFGISRRSIAVSTAGVAPGIERFAKECPQVHLALSLHAAKNELRDRLVPINRAHPVGDLIKSLKRYFKASNRKVFLEYVLLAGENDQPAHALELVQFIRKVGPIHLLHVNLIVWNPTDTSHEPSSRQRAREFKDFLIRHGVFVTIRKNLGQDIDGACGQLVVNARG